jgi:nitrogenase molybdenum-iron protein alpha/beta subunit
MAKDIKSIIKEVVKENEPDVSDVVEAGFRRGFAHGVHNLTEAVAPHLSAGAKARLRAYDEQVRKWRISKKRDFPPNPPDLSE